MKKRAVMAGVLAIAVVGGALYLFGYQLQEPGPTPAAPPPVVRKPQLALTPVAKPATPQPVAPASSVPAIAAPKAQPVVAQAPSVPAPVPEITAEAATPEPIAQKPEPKKSKAATKPRQVAKPEQAATPEPVAKLDVKVDDQDASQQAPTKPQDVLLKPAYPPAEPAPVAPVEPITPAEPAPMPAPDEPVVPPPVESAMGAPAPQRGAITPKYNDVMTAVLRGDKDAARELLDLGRWVDKPSDSGVTPLMAAVMNRDAEMVQLLLDYGAEPTSQALRLARKNKDDATASLLEQKGAH